MMTQLIAVVGIALTAALSALPCVAQLPYTLVDSSQGANFFELWNFYTGIDANNTGNVYYVTKDFATANGLATVNAAGRAIVKVDNTTDGTGNDTYGRNSVKMLSDWTFYEGSLVVFDAVHMPYGCSVWPALWSEGPGEWPNAGEIDIIEGVNNQLLNRISLHTLDGCEHPPDSVESGTLISADCYNATSFNQGCLIEVPGPSYGAGFAGAGGGAYALEWREDGIRLWFWERSAMPAELAAGLNVPVPESWGMPTAFYPKTSCDFDVFFEPQSLILQTTICGNYAGNPAVFTPACGEGLCTDLIQIPTNFDTAFWEINYVKHFLRTELITTTTSPTSTTNQQADTNTSTPPPTASDGNGANAAIISPAASLAVVLVMISAVIWFGL